jgi:hypothetical protein
MEGIIRSAFVAEAALSGFKSKRLPEPEELE